MNVEKNTENLMDFYKKYDIAMFSAADKAARQEIEKKDLGDIIASKPRDISAETASAVYLLVLSAGDILIYLATWIPETKTWDLDVEYFISDDHENLNLALKEFHKFGQLFSQSVPDARNRFARCRRSGRDSSISSFLPSGYRVLGASADWVYLIGQDNAGWTLEGYVIPRLASGLIGCEEIDGDTIPQPLATEL